MYGVTVHVHAPEFSADIQPFQTSTAEAQQFHILHTSSWECWYKDENDKFARSWGGDHWQVIELNNGRKIPLSKASGGTASQASAARTALKLPLQNPALSSRKLDFSDCNAEQQNMGQSTEVRDTNLLAAVNQNDPMSAAPKDKSQAKQTLVIGDSERQSFVGSTAVQLMLRAVASDPYVYNPIPNHKTVDGTTFRTIGGQVFVEHDFGNYFHGVYRSGTAKVLLAFPDLNENQRSFFLALGMGAGMDPFMLQCLFRTQAERLESNPNIAKKKHMTTLLTPNTPIDYDVLTWCWPPEFDDICVLVVEKQQEKWFLFEKEHARQRKMILLSRDKYSEYQLLLLNPKTKTEAEAALRKRATKIHLNEFIAPTECCQSICKFSKFDMFEKEDVFLAAALPGCEPTPNEYNTVWEGALKACGLECDQVTESWTKVPGWFQKVQTTKKTKSHIKDGSLRQSSWQILRSKLVEAFDAETSTSCDVREQTAPEKRSLRSALNSPARQTKESSSSSLPCVFLDCGSEAGRAIFQMMQSSRINHIAGIELQNSWFRVSTVIMKYVRQEFQKKKYRMPEVTLINSCMVAQTPLLTWMYSVASIIWMNNFVFDKTPYFNSRDPTSAESSTKALVPGKQNNTLSINAALNFSRHLEGTTLIAVHDPTCFAEIWNYTHSKPVHVSCTWSGFDASGKATNETVTIVKHIQHLHIARGFHLRSASIADSNAFETWKTDWSAFKNAAIPGHDPDQLQAFEYERNKHSAPHRISSKEMVSLGHGRWLVSEIIVMYMFLLEKHFQDICFSISNIVDFHLKTLKNLEKQFGKHDTMIFCQHIHNNHWIGIKLEKTKRRITICDSFHGGNDDSFAHVESLAERLGILGPLEHNLVKVPHQMNCNDCGVTTCLFMLCMAHNVENELTYDDSRFVSRHFRLRLFADIVKKTVTPLQKI
jgi:hypothetical protein